MPFASQVTRLLLVTCTLTVTFPALTPCSEAATPWAMIARRAIGRVEQLSQPPMGEQPGFDVATVVLNADAAKVYATAVGLLRKNQSVHVCRRRCRASDGSIQQWHALRWDHGHRSRDPALTDASGVYDHAGTGLGHDADRGWNPEGVSGDEGDVQHPITARVMRRTEPRKVCYSCNRAVRDPGSPSAARSLGGDVGQKASRRFRPSEVWG
jgi:hypothetical protein